MKRIGCIRYSIFDNMRQRQWKSFYRIMRETGDYFELEEHQCLVADRIVSLMKLDTEWYESFERYVNVPDDFYAILLDVSRIKSQVLEEFELDKCKTLEEMREWISLLRWMS